jgi:NTE family protein
MTASGASDAGFTIVARSNRTGLNSAGGEWVNQAQIGRLAAILSEFYQPLAAGSRWYVAPRFTLRRQSSNLYLGDSNIALYKTSSATAGIDLGRYVGTLGEARVGLLTGQTRSTMEIGLPILRNETFRVGAWTARVDIDKLDNLNFPNKGQRVRLDIIGSRPGLGADLAYTRTRLDWTGAYSWRNNNFTANLIVGQTVDTGEIPVFETFNLGGFQRLSGYGLDRFRARDIAFGSIGYRRVINPPLGLELGGLIDRMYAGASFEAARIRESIDPLTPDGNYYSGSVYIGSDTLIGPVFVGFGYADRDNQAIWLAIGRPWLPR